MLFLNLRNRFQRRRFDRADQHDGLQRQSTTTTLEQRADEIHRLLSEVHRLQFEIADLDGEQQRIAADGESSRSGEHMQKLEDELAQTQQALARLQGRI